MNEEVYNNTRLEASGISRLRSVINKYWLQGINDRKNRKMLQEHRNWLAKIIRKDRNENSGNHKL